ncbi:DNA-binding transcriptional regulator [Exilibacterium tricleocarpae]|uniref:DNA-binding transcriptional regulator n=1 Tax=Exilibacterium tricleocarpae TaxID=2591008 RepID=A0A545TS59_9GAMM|nr:DNA-binding transcriptional regulator [Exilibacterium tricleocarpae]TQV80052.1 DNA-binding transcriptional regulator [Exilibacterium tricleocarpae]
MPQSRLSITLLFNANKAYDRQVIEGIGRYLQASKVGWDVYLEEDFHVRLHKIRDWKGDGVIADFDDPDVAAALSHSQVPVIAVGGSYMNEDDYPPVPYVATDNYDLVKTAYAHLKHKGFERFAFYGLPPHPGNRWGREREQAMLALTQADGYECQVYRGRETAPQTWHYTMNRLADWLLRLPTPIGIVAVTDARARHLLQACEEAELLVPDRVGVIGIDDDEIARHLSRISLSSVSQGCRDMGYHAARLLHLALSGRDIGRRRLLVPATGVAARQSTDFKALRHPDVMQAMHFIRQNACKGIKVDQVLDYVGVSRSNLEKRFKDEVGHTLHHEIHNAKLEKACLMLQSDSPAIAEVANICGYPSLQYMYAVFKKHFDATPKEYRQRALSGRPQPLHSAIDTGG